MSSDVMEHSDGTINIGKEISFKLTKAYIVKTGVRALVTARIFRHVSRMITKMIICHYQHIQFTAFHAPR